MNEKRDQIKSGLMTSYDTLAQEYANRFSNELDHKPMDRELLKQFAAEVGTDGLICDIGCGPGQIGGYLSQLGARVCGLDYSFDMARIASRLNSGLPFFQADMLHLPFADASLVGIVAFYSVIHVRRELIPGVASEFYRALRSGGLLALSVHLGEDLIHAEELWGYKVSIDFLLYSAEEINQVVSDSGLSIVETFERAPYEEVEYPTRRYYILARKN